MRRIRKPKFKIGQEVFFLDKKQNLILGIIKQWSCEVYDMFNPKFSFYIENKKGEGFLLREELIFNNEEEYQNYLDCTFEVPLNIGESVYVYDTINNLELTKVEGFSLQDPKKFSDGSVKFDTIVKTKNKATNSWHNSNIIHTNNSSFINYKKEV